MKALLFDEEHADVEFLVGSARERIPAHKAVLTARYGVGRVGILFCNYVSGLSFILAYSGHVFVGSFLFRSDYFKALFRKGGMKESEEGRVVIEGCNVPTVRRMLEFIYTNRIEALSSCCASEIIDLLSVADEYLMTVR